jgi:hypothetical protein
MATSYENWIDEENLEPALTAIGWICDYKFDSGDWDAVSTGVKTVDESKNIWFDYTLAGKFEIRTRITKESGSSNFSLRIESSEDIKDRLDMIIGLAQCYKIQEF